MKNKFKIQLIPTKLKATLTSSFALMTFIPLLSATYLLYRYTFKEVLDTDLLSAMMLIALFSGFIGFILLKRIVEAIINLASQAKRIEETGNLKNIEYEEDNEIGKIVSSFNSVMVRLKGKVQELENMNHQLQVLSITDDLTGLYNFRSFRGFLEKEISRSNRKGYKITLLMMDLDNFKEFNDLYGHLEGNEFLKFLSKHLKDGVRLYDIVSRYGGDEFAIILPETGFEEAKIVGERMHHVLSKQRAITQSGAEEPISISIGSASFECGKNTPCEPEKLIKAADQALYRAKSKGKGILEMEKMAS